MIDDSVVDVVPIGIASVGRGYKVTLWNQWMAVHSGLEPETVLGTSIFSHFPSLNNPSFLRACKAVFTFGNVVYQSQRLHEYLFPFELPVGTGSDFRYMQQSCTLTPVRADCGAVESVLITVQDVTDSVRLEQRLRRINQTDCLTGSHNRRYLDERLALEYRRHQRYGRPLSLCMIDLDRFKLINDSFGHLAGDHAITEVARIVKKELRAFDVCARFGGEEFACLLPETTVRQAATVAERIRKAVETTTISWRDAPLSVTASIGVATMIDGRVDVQDLVGRADAALYVAKSSGRNCVRTHQPSPGAGKSSGGAELSLARLQFASHATANKDATPSRFPRREECAYRRD